MELMSSTLLRAIHEERVAELQREMLCLRLRRQKPSFLMPLRLWTGEMLIRLGKWVKRQGAGDGTPAMAVAVTGDA